MGKLYACYATSDYYARETGISMIGFFENNPDYEPDEFFILDYGVLDENKMKLDGIAAKYGKKITYLPAKQILEEIQSKLNLKDFRGSLATYSRAFIDKIMPQYVERLLYIDSDTVVIGSISELKSFAMGNACIAGIISSGFSHQIKHKKLKLYSNNSLYYGCGIVLYDLQNWRSRGCFEKIKEMLNIKKEYPCADQTLINNSLEESCFKKLPLKYNYTTHTVSVAFENGILKRDGFYTSKEIYIAKNHPVVIHYPGSPLTRPWFEGCQSRKKEEYYQIKQMSPWSTDKLYDSSIYRAGNIKGRKLISYYIHQLEIKTHSYYLATLIINMRSLVGEFLRFLGIYQKIPSEGLE